MTIFFYFPAASSFVALGPSDTAYSEGFTLGLSKLSKPDITTDIIHCDTTADVKSDATTWDILQSEEESRSHYIEREAARDSRTGEGDGDPEPKAHVSAMSGFIEEEDETAKDSQTEEGDGDPEPIAHVSARSGFIEEEDETAKDSQTEEGDGDPEPIAHVSARSGFLEEEDETVKDSQREKEGHEDFQPEVDGSTRSQSPEVEETGQDSEEECGNDSQAKVDVSARPMSEEEEDQSAQDCQTVNAQTKEASAASAVGCQSEEEENITEDGIGHKSLTEEDLPYSQAEDEELEEGGDGHQSEEQEHEHLNSRDHCSGGGITHTTEPHGVTSETGENSLKN